jgi:hypothetical protein
MQIAISPSRLIEHQSGFPQIGHGCLCETRASGAEFVRILGSLSFVESPSEIVACPPQGIVCAGKLRVQFFESLDVLRAARTDAGAVGVR